MTDARVQEPGRITVAGVSLAPPQAVLLLIAVTAVLRVAAASSYGLGIDESYMFGNSRIFAWSYYDAPPLHVWLVQLWSQITGSESAGVLRLPFIVLFAGSTWLMYRLTADLFGARAGVIAAIAFNLAPVFTLGHSSWILPDGPLIFFLLAGAVIAARILFVPRPDNAALLWMAAGACGGLAFMSKYHGVFFFLAIFVFLLTVPDQRRWLATPGPWLGIAVALLVASPVIVWNLQNAFAGAAFQAERLSGVSGLSLTHFSRSVGGQFLYLTPWLGAVLTVCLVSALRRGPAAPKTWLISLLAIGPILFFTAAALFARGLPHWEMPGWLFTFPLLGLVWLSLEQKWPRLARGSMLAAVAVLLVVTGVLVAQAATGSVGRAVPGLFKPRDATADLVNWDMLPSALRERGLINADTPAVAAFLWIEAGKANYALGGRVRVLCVCDRPQQFGLVQNLSQYAGKNLILVGTARELSRRKADFTRHFASVEQLPPVVVRRGGEPVIELQLYRGIGFKP